jgi:hypothetical protein
MKTRIIFPIITMVIICSWTNPTKPGYLYLNSSRLKPLGITLNDNGVFYKNFNPKWEEEKAVYSSLSFCCTNKIYLTTNHYLPSETITPDNRNDKLLMKLETTKNDFYPILIGNPEGKQSLDNETLPSDLKLFPVAICMSETKLSNRKDTIVVWFKPTLSLQKALPDNIKMENYLQVPTRIK